MQNFRLGHNGLKRGKKRYLQKNTCLTSFGQCFFDRIDTHDSSLESSWLKGRLNENFFPMEISIFQKLGSKNSFKIPRAIFRVMNRKKSKKTLTEILHFWDILAMTHV